jgi:CBS domain-containing protein
LRDSLLPLYPNHGYSVMTDVYVVVNVLARDDAHSRNFVEMEAGYPEVLGGKVEEIMSQNLLTVASHDPILGAASYMGRRNFRRIRVVDMGALVGMVSISNINRGLFFEQGMRH